MQVVVSHPTGNRNVRAVIDNLLAADLLAEFCTTLAVAPDSFVLKLLPAALRRELQRRAFDIPFHKIFTHPQREVLRILLPKAGLHQFTRYEDSFAGIDKVYQDFDQNTAKRLTTLAKNKNVDAVYAYEDGALATFQKAKELGIKCIYDLPIAYWEYGRKLMEAEARRLPDWACTLGGGINDSEEKLERKTKEMELADMIVAPGTFVTRSLPEWAKTKFVHVSPFGSPASDETSKKEQSNRRLRVLFAGSMGQRKGLGDLFEAMKLLKTSQIELVVMGSLLAPMEFYRTQYADFTYEPGRPHDQVLALMRSCDVFCLPSIVEGRALVMQEAMSQGLPIIITPNTGGEDLIIPGKTGFLVPVSSAESIAEKLTWFLENRTEIPQMGIFARQHSATYTWDAYGSSIGAALTKQFGG
ncbi:glycosyltransferase family 4 protein [Pedobacter sp. P351]|uniref:glycosyltransferase family 4 protein n=1 Tax=Pedobacter superstes TaxID=3133441 RepID=UPI0030AB4F3E